MQCAIDLTDKAARGELPTAYGREQEIEQILTSLASPLKGRILVTGAPRVGKTAVIQEVAARIKAGKCPEALRGSELWSLSPRSILRAFGVQGWQEKLGLLMERWAERPDVILYVDALPSIAAAGATMDDPFDMAQFLLGQLQNSGSRILAEGRTGAVASFLGAYPEYKHILLEVKIGEPGITEAQYIIGQAAEDLEIGQGVTIDPEAVGLALDLTRHFALSEALPGKAIDLIGETIALQAERQDGLSLISSDQILMRFAQKTGLPRILLSDDEPYDENAVRRYFSTRVLGQEQAVDAVVQALSLLRTRLNNPRRPMGVFLFIGSTGVGKSELARALAQFLFNNDELIVRFNMADYTQDWQISTLFGNPHGFDAESRRGQFTIRLQDHAFAVILLDEFEKAHPEVFQRFLQLFDEGILINGASEMVNLRNTIVILTSNFGAQMLAASRLGFGPDLPLEAQEHKIHEEMIRFFTPELINRLDSVCFFKPLTKPILREIAYRRVQEVLQREGITRRQISVEVDEDVIEWVVEHGYSERYGARYLARQIEKAITYPVAQQLIRNEPPPGSLVRLFLRNNRVASALVLPARSTGEMAPVAALTDAHRLPRWLSLADMRTGLPLLRERVERLEAAHNFAEARAQLSDLMEKLSTPSFWDEPAALQPHLHAISRLSGQVELIDGLRRNLAELMECLEEAQSDHSEVLGEAALRYRFLVRELPRAELLLLFTEPWDTYGVYLCIEPRGRRKAAQGWATELAQMYLKWAERRHFAATILSDNLSGRGDERGIWLGIEGYGAYGLLKGEIGTHRLVQPGGEEGSRQVVTARVKVWPDLPEEELPPANGQEMQIQRQAISRSGKLVRRLTTHVEACLPGLPPLVLVSDLPADDLATEARTLLRVQSLLAVEAVTAPGDPEWGSVVRSYIRYKNRMVHDTRTGLKTGKLKATLNGDLDPFLEAFLHTQARSRSEKGDNAS
ncbi:MAG: hypothetical protein Kow00124_05600 [Anaerolineae bacterium]